MIFPAGTTQSTGTVVFTGASGNPTAAPAGATATYKYMDQFFNTLRNDGIVSIAPVSPDNLSAVFTALKPGTQSVQVDIPGLPSARFVVTVAAPPAPELATGFIVTFSTPV